MKKGIFVALALAALTTITAAALLVGYGMNMHRGAMGATLRGPRGHMRPSPMRRGHDQPFACESHRDGQSHGRPSCMGSRHAPAKPCLGDPQGPASPCDAHGQASGDGCTEHDGVDGRHHRHHEQNVPGPACDESCPESDHH